LYRDGVYYWYGEYRSSQKFVRPTTGDTYGGFNGLSVYSSTDLMNWTYCGLTISPVADDPSSEFNPEDIIERPKVLFNEASGKYVMWFHVEDPDRTLNRVGVAISDTPTGTFAYQGSFRPLGLDSRDMTLFQDDDGRAYLVFTVERNSSLRIARLTDDYLALTGEAAQPYISSNKREAPAMLKTNGKYFLLTSGVTGFDPNPSMYAVADTVLGQYTIVGNPFSGIGSSTSYQSQPAFILPIAGTSDFIYMGDRWNRNALDDSRYVWSPLRINGSLMTIDAPKPF
jgi:beta-galactosidase